MRKYIDIINEALKVAPSNSGHKYALFVAYANSSTSMFQAVYEDREEILADAAAYEDDGHRAEVYHMLLTYCDGKLLEAQIPTAQHAAKRYVVVYWMPGRIVRVGTDRSNQPYEDFDAAMREAEGAESSGYMAQVCTLHPVYQTAS